MSAQVGDVVAFWGTDWSSRVIRLLTWRPWYRWTPSHVGIVVEWAGRLAVFESTTLCSSPCLVRGRRVSGPQVQWLDERVQQYGGRVRVYRPTKPLNTWILTNMIRQTCLSGSAYDMSHAIVSGVPGGRLALAVMDSAWALVTGRSKSTLRLYCSELLMWAFQASGQWEWGCEWHNPASALWWLWMCGRIKPVEKRPCPTRSSH